MDEPEVDEADSGQRQPMQQEQQDGHIPGSTSQISAIMVELASLRGMVASMTIKNTDLEAHVVALEVAHKEESQGLQAEMHALRQQLARRTVAEVLSTPGPSTSTPSHISATPRPASRPATTSATPAAPRPPAEGLPPPPTRPAPRARAAPPQDKPAFKELFVQLPAGSPAGATAAQMEALFTSQAHVPCTVKVLPSRRSRTGPRESVEESPDSVRAMAALGLVMVPQQRGPDAQPPAAGTPEDTRQRFIVTFAMESERAVWGSYSKLRRLSLIFHDNLSPEQQRRKASQKGVADTLRASGPIRWDYDQLSKLVNRRWVAVPFAMQ